MKTNVMVLKQLQNFACVNSTYHIYCTDISQGRDLVQL